MTVARAFAIIIASGVGFAVGGGAVGYGLAVYVPAYFRVVFPHADSPGFDPVPLGIGLGTSQGLIAGLVIGAVVVLAVAIASSRERGERPPNRP